MTHNEYEQSKRRLEEARRTGVEMVEAAYQAQMRALEMVWMLQGGLAEGIFSSAGSGAPAPAAQEPPSPPPTRPRKQSADEVDDDVRANFWRLPESFSRGDVCEALGYEPDRGALYRCLKRLREEGSLDIESKGSGQKATIYRKAGGGSPPA